MMTARTTRQPDGYIALISAIIIASILLGLSFEVSTAGFFSRFNVLNSEFKRVSLALAEACANTAFLKLAQNYNYDLAADPAYDAAKAELPLAVGANSCSIKSLALGAPANQQETATIQVQAVYQQAFSNLKIIAKLQDPAAAPNPAFSPNISILSWQENP